MRSIFHCHLYECFHGRYKAKSIDETLHKSDSLGCVYSYSFNKFGNTLWIEFIIQVICSMCLDMRVRCLSVPLIVHSEEPLYPQWCC